MIQERHNNNGDCLSDETLTLWTQGLLSSSEEAKVKAHLNACGVCRDLARTLEAVVRQTSPQKNPPVPEEVSVSSRKFVTRAWEQQIARIILMVKDGLYSAAQTTGEVLLAPWLSPPVVTRADIQARPSSVVVETVYQDLRCLVESSRNDQDRHTLKASFSRSDTGQPIVPSQFILWEGDEEIESQMSSEGKVIFEDLPAGLYRLTMRLPDGRQGHLDFHLIPS